MNDQHQVSQQQGRKSRTRRWVEQKSRFMRRKHFQMDSGSADRNSLQSKETQEFLRKFSVPTRDACNTSRSKVHSVGCLILFGFKGADRKSKFFAAAIAD
jgi:hypothetical protein